jgi:hypothetical protein
LVADTAVIIVTGNRMNRKIYASAKAANIFRPYYPDSIMHQQIEDAPVMDADTNMERLPVTGGDKTLKTTPVSSTPSTGNSGQSSHDWPIKPSLDHEYFQQRSNKSMGRYTIHHEPISSIELMERAAGKSFQLVGY